MAVTGSGKFVKLVGGVISFGIDSTTYTEIYKEQVTQSGNTFSGIRYTGQYLGITGLNEFVLDGRVAFTGTIKMYTCLYMEPNLFGDTYVNAYADDIRFVNGFMVGRA